MDEAWIFDPFWHWLVPAWIILIVKIIRAKNRNKHWDMILIQSIFFCLLGPFSIILFTHGVDEKGNFLPPGWLGY